MRRMKKAGQYLLGIFAALLLCGIFSVNTVKADIPAYLRQCIASFGCGGAGPREILRGVREQYGNSYGHPDRAQQRFRGLSGDCR